ncbi:MAG: DNA-directed RNA polymerase subunit omega [Candidatus Omnitrophica bacterium]|nr:DNA-directed RNA polymerase subunit omega [Candidatus Omnitrophota bacterium]
MAYQPLEELLPKANDSIYRLVRLASKRALELSETGAKLIIAPTEQKLTTTALEEIRQSKVVEKPIAQEESASGPATRRVK